MKLSIIVIKFLFIGALFIVSTQNLYLSDGDDLDKFTELYYSWLSGIFSNLKEMSAYVVKSEWLPGENAISLNLDILRNFGDK